MIKVSIIIVNWNTKGFLVDCIDSIPSACGALPYEVIIVDNASIDGSSGFIKERYPCVKLIENQENLGFAKACNQGAKISSGNYLFLLNPDTILYKEAVSRLVGFMEEEPLAGAVGPQLLNREGELEDSVRRFPTMCRLLVRDTILGKFIKVPRFQYSLSMDRASIVDQVSGAGLLVRRQLWERLGGMDERFFMFYEDVDLCRRIKDMGYNAFYLPTAKVIHLGGGSRHQDRSSVLYYSLRSKFLYLEKYNHRWKVLIFKSIYKPLFLVRILLRLYKMDYRVFIKRYFLNLLRI